MARYYPATVEANADGFGVFFDVLGCTSGGATLQEAARNAADARLEAPCGGTCDRETTFG